MTSAEEDRAAQTRRRRVLVVLFVVVHVVFVARPFDVLDPVDPWAVGRALWQGVVPYRDLAFEYPPGALVAFLLPGAVPQGWANSVLALQAVAVEAVVLWLLWRVDREGAFWRYVLASVVLFPLLSGGFDVFAMAAIAGSTAALAAGRARGWWLAAAGSALKLFPGVAWGWADVGRPVQAGALVVTLVVLAVPLALAPAEDTWIGYHLERGVQFESVPATLGWVANGVTGEPSSYTYRFRATELDGAGPWASVTVATFAVLVAAVCWCARRRGVGARLPWLCAYSVLLLVLCGSKVLSPQFMVLGAPLAAVLGGRWFVAHLAMVVLTVLAHAGGWSTFMEVIAVRNSVLVATALVSFGVVIRATRVDDGAGVSGRPVGAPG